MKMIKMKSAAALVGGGRMFDLSFVNPLMYIVPAGALMERAGVRREKRRALAEEKGFAEQVREMVYLERLACKVFAVEQVRGMADAADASIGGNTSDLVRTAQRIFGPEAGGGK